MEDYKGYIAGGWCFIAICTAFFTVGLYMLAKQIQAGISYTPIQAEIIEQIESYDEDDGSVTYYNKVQYTVDGKNYTKVCDTPAGKTTIGDYIKIYVNPKNPRDVVFSNSTHWILIVASITMSCGGYALSGYLLWKGNKLKNE